MRFPNEILLIDLETTGLSREQDQIISIGLTYLAEDGKPTTSYWFLENPAEEKELLVNFLDFITNYTALFSYYGKGFEFPFILSRLEHYHLDPSSFLRLKLIDLKGLLKHFAKTRLELEALFHYKRHCQSTGQDIVKLYRTYITSQSEIYKTCILEHQKEEMVSLFFFWELYSILSETNKWKFISKEPKDNVLKLIFKISGPASYTFSGIACGITFSYIKDEDILEIVLPLFNGTLKHYLEPLKDYYYIDSQNQLMHKSLAQFIPSSLKRKATKEECAISKSSKFLPIFTKYKSSIPLWFDDEQKIYIEYDDFTLDSLFIQLFHLFFHNAKKGGKD